MEKSVLMELAQNPLSTKYSWNVHIRPALEISLEECNLGELKGFISNFNSSPFTIQRIAELLLNPSYHTSHLDKFRRALEKCLKVTSLIDKREDLMELSNDY